jgi:hypothetical protein
MVLTVAVLLREPSLFFDEKSETRNCPDTIEIHCMGRDFFPEKWEYHW